MHRVGGAIILSISLIDSASESLIHTLILNQLKNQNNHHPVLSGDLLLLSSVPLLLPGVQELPGVPLVLLVRSPRQMHPFESGPAHIVHTTQEAGCHIFVGSPLIVR